MSKSKDTVKLQEIMVHLEEFTMMAVEYSKDFGKTRKFDKGLFARTYTYVLTKLIFSLLYDNETEGEAFYKHYCKAIEGYVK